MQTLYRVATDVGQDSPSAVASSVPSDALGDGRAPRVSLREHLVALIGSLASARVGFGD
jgi:hypothetical protein